MTMGIMSIMHNNTQAPQSHQKHCLLLRSIENLEDLQEEIDDVEIEINGSENVFLGRQLVEQHVGVHNNETRKQNGTEDGEHELHGLTLNEHLHDTT